MITICQGIKCISSSVSKGFFLYYKKFSFILMQIDLCKNLTHFRLLILTEKDDDIFQDSPRLKRFLKIFEFFRAKSLSRTFCIIFQLLSSSIPNNPCEGQNDSFEISKLGIHQMSCQVSFNCHAKDQIFNLEGLFHFITVLMRFQQLC